MAILLVDDDRELILAISLRRAGLEAIAARDAADALRCFAQCHPEVVVLDSNLGASSVLEVLKELRQLGSAPVIVVSALHSKAHRVRAFELGADDYVTKPCTHRELIARIRVQLRRSSRRWTAPRGSDAPLQAGGVTLDAARRCVVRAGQRVNLTVTECRLLHCLMNDAGNVVPIDQLVGQVWGQRNQGASDVLRVMVHRLRGKLEDDPSRPQLLRTVPGVGVQFNTDSKTM